MKLSVMQGKSLRLSCPAAIPLLLTTEKQQSAPAQGAQADEALGEMKKRIMYLLYL